jgi:plasmid stability protein
MKSLINGRSMASMTIRNFDDRLKSKLRVRAAQHGRSMEDEARHILKTALSGAASEPNSLVEAIRSRIEPLGGIELDLPGREGIPAPLNFEP